jgi:hypothetical protein
MSSKLPSYLRRYLCTYLLLRSLYKYLRTFEGNNLRLQRPESGCVAWVLACVGVCVVRPFPGGRHSHAARRAGRDRGASGAGDAVNG